jgi:hypothetical protein
MDEFGAESAPEQGGFWWQQRRVLRSSCRRRDRLSLERSWFRRWLVIHSNQHLAGPTPLFLMDMPMLRYEDDTLGIYYAFGFRDGTVSGASAMYRSPDELAWEVLGTGNDGPVFGWAAGALC